MPYSHHSHSGQFCKHAQGRLEDVVLEAIRQGFSVYGLTEHVPRYRLEDLYPEETTMSLGDLEAQFDAFLVEAWRLKAEYASRISLLVGLETEFITDLDLQRLHAVLQKHSGRIEYLVGSIHHVAAVPIDFDVATFERARDRSNSGRDEEGQEHFLCSYFDAQFNLMQEFQPEIIGHFDLCRLYTPSLQFKDYPRAMKLVRRNIEYAVGYGALFELNSAALRKGWSSAYPGEDVVQLIQMAGGRFALSDDSHGPTGVGLNYSRLYDYLRGINLTDIWYLAYSEEANYAGRHVTAIKAPGNWWEEKFWISRQSQQAHADQA